MENSMRPRCPGQVPSIIIRLVIAVLASPALPLAGPIDAAEMFAGCGEITKALQRSDSCVKLKIDHLCLCACPLLNVAVPSKPQPPARLASGQPSRKAPTSSMPGLWANSGAGLWAHDGASPSLQHDCLASGQPSRQVEPSLQHVRPLGKQRCKPQPAACLASWQALYIAHRWLVAAVDPPKCKLSMNKKVPF
jgi:hypothetical protein